MTSMLKLIVSSFLVLFLSQHVCSSRILAVVQTASYSHQVFYQQLWRELAIRGHDTVVITSDPTNEKLPNFREISIKETYSLMKKFIDDLMETSVIEMVAGNVFMEEILKMNEFTLNLPQVQELIHSKTERFDLVMIENFFGPVLGFQHHYKCPLIGVISLDAVDAAHEVMGNSVHSILYPMSVFDMKDSSVFLRTVVFLMHIVFNISPYRSMEKIDRISRNIFGEDTPPIEDIFASADMLFTNANPLFASVRPHTPSTINIAGGMHLKPPKPLPKDLQQFLDSAKEGAIYFSLGSNVKSNEVTMELRQTIMDTFKQLPYKVLWKFEDDSLVGKPNNVHLSKWAPQQDVLRHKNVKLFISQCGIQSVEEALYLHVPIVAMPFFGDQLGNAANIKNKGMGVLVDRHALTVENFKYAILEVMDNPVYRDTVKRLATQIQDTPMTSLDRAVWWTEYVLRHKGAQHLKGPRIPFYQYYYLDVLALLAFINIIIFTSVFIILRKCIRKITGSNGAKHALPKKLKKM